jgi:hypothetical protein
VYGAAVAFDLADGPEGVDMGGGHDPGVLHGIVKDDPFRLSAFTAVGWTRRVYRRALLRAGCTGCPLDQPRVLAQVLAWLPMREAMLAGRVCTTWRALFLRTDLVYWKRACRRGLVPPSFRGAFWLMMAYDATPELEVARGQAAGGRLGDGALESRSRGGSMAGEWECGGRGKLFL